MTQIRVALNISRLSVSGKVNRSQNMITGIANNSQVFVSPGSVLTDASAAVNSLQAAMLDAEDGGKSKTAIMHDRETELITAMNRLAAYVESVAKGDPAIIHLAGMDVKQGSAKTVRSFDVFQNGTPGLVTLTVEPQDKTLYKWEYCKDPIGPNTWTEGNRTNTSKSTIGSLSPGLYWFRVTTENVSGEHVSDTVAYVVR